MNTIKKIVLTGGPCAGKTTALVKVIEHFTSLGYKVFTIPEVPTMFTQSGMNYLTKNEKFFFEGEKATFLTQIGLEDSFSRMAETLDQPVIIVCDRGTMDISTYLSEDFWNRIISEHGYSNTQLRERYDAVLHLVSAADGAEQFYTTANNAQRLEKADEAGLQIARELDKKIVSAWKGHPHLRVINNHEDFENKLNRVLKEISNVLGIPQPIEEERKYIVKLVGEVPNAIDSDIVQTYLSVSRVVKSVSVAVVLRVVNMFTFILPRSVFRIRSRLRQSVRSMLISMNRCFSRQTLTVPPSASTVRALSGRDSTSNWIPSSSQFTT